MKYFILSPPPRSPVRSPVRLGIPPPRAPRTSLPAPLLHPTRPSPRAPLVRLGGRARCPHRAAAPWRGARLCIPPPRPRRIARGSSPPRCAAWQVAHAESFAGASPCAPHSRAGRGVRSPTRGTAAGPNHYTRALPRRRDACPPGLPAHATAPAKTPKSLCSYTSRPVALCVPLC